jgi:protein-tyrosine-phosphatase
MTDDPLRVVFVCHANRARSAYAHLRAQQLAGPALDIGSGGTHGRPDEPMEPGMLLQLRRHGIDGTSFRSRPLARADVEAADLVLTAEAAQRARILEDHPQALRRVFTMAQFAKAVEHVEPGASDVVATAFAARVPARPRDDVPDPWGREPEVAATSAAYLDGLLDTIVTALVARPAS